MNYTKDKKTLDFEYHQELNRVRASAMATACSGLTTAELKELNPNLLRAAPELYEACRLALQEASWQPTREDVKDLMRKALAKADT